MHGPRGAVSFGQLPEQFGQYCQSGTLFTAIKTRSVSEVCLPLHGTLHALALTSMHITSMHVIQHTIRTWAAGSS